MSRNICFSFECPHQTEALLGKQIFMRRPATLWHSQIRCAAFQIALMTFDSLNWEHSTKHMQAAVQSSGSTAWILWDTHWLRSRSATILIGSAAPLIQRSSIFQLNPRQSMRSLTNSNKWRRWWAILLVLTARHNKSLDASGGSVFRNVLGAAQGALIRAAASTQPLCASVFI